MHPTAKHWTALLALGLIWGGTFMVMALALRGYGPFTVATARVVLGALSLGALMLLMRRPLPARDAWPWLIVIGILNTALPFFLLSWGLTQVPSAFAGITMAALPLFVLPLAHVFSDERLTRQSVTGVALGFLGALVLIGPGVLSLGTGGSGWGQMAWSIPELVGGRSQRATPARTCRRALRCGWTWIGRWRHLIFHNLWRFKKKAALRGSLRA